MKYELSFVTARYQRGEFAENNFFLKCLFFLYPHLFIILLIVLYMHFLWIYPRWTKDPPPPQLKERLPTLASWLFHFGEFSYPPLIKVSLWLFVTKEYRAHRTKVFPIDHAIFMFLFLFSLLFRHAFFISNAFFNSALVLLNFFMNWVSNSG